MYVHSSRRGFPLAISVLGAVALLAICPGTAAVAAPNGSGLHLAGTWSGKYAGAYSGTFTLRWTQVGSKLNGSITLSKPRGKYPITGRVSGTAITFGAVGAGATYTGSVSAKSMSGRYKTATGGGTWSAKKIS